MKWISTGVVLLMSACITEAQAARDFFAFDNGLTQIKTPKEKVEVLKEFGYAGIGSRSGQVSELLPELKAAGLKMYSSYVGIQADDKEATYDARLPGEINLLKGEGTFIWLFIRGDRKKNLDEHVVKTVRDVAEMADKAGLQVSIYPHKGFYVATALDSLRIAEKVDHPNVGASFNLCHFLMQNNVDDLEKVIRKVASRMNLVSINGADRGSNLPEVKAIQRLDKGDFDMGKLLELLDEVKYEGPVGLQCYAIEGDNRENLAASMSAWKRMTSKK